CTRAELQYLDCLDYW
nr:immunoglobulin heavy chain junction region [Macaca mulatta]MOV41044.1 immunoglobulin heavy chain junction region [Macaca mulatta]MOV42483.1 immunoglobulin heavy chain junction region [Macaca mulatta]MOV42523.1 immunoglobulin heavy chain junction region [Macaca mulatta]MOV42538.1 immunoglobulin heavy chain junction region [Macaca mulatta]